MPAAKLSHLDEAGRARMVDVSDKEASQRIAVAEGWVRMAPQTLALLRDKALKKGDALSVAQVAGVQAAKRTAELIPFCHTLLLEHVGVEFELHDNPCGVRIVATVRITGKTGVEMEALTAVSVAALTLYDMAKAAEKSMQIEGVRLLSKTGGKSGEYVASPSES